MIYGIYERLRHQELIQRPTFNLPLTQDQIADHLGLTMVHISRTLRRMRDEKLLFVYRGS
jgi:DNA-binding transcriptional regulator LsrR (DeoR family)